MKIVHIWLVSLVIKLAVGGFLPFLSDEFYYWVWGQNPSLSYYDHPPMVGWLFWVSDFLGLHIGQIERWPGIIVSHVSLLFWIKILERRLSGDQIKYWLLLVLLNPITGFGSLIVTPDAPLLLFWSICIYLFDRATEAPNWKHFSLLGLSMGLAFCSKYHAVLLVPIFVAAAYQTHRLVSVAKYTPLMAIFGIVGSLPVIAWNYSNDWVSFLFQFRHGLGGESWRPSWTLLYLLGQIGLLFPTTIWAARKWVGRMDPLIKWNALFPLFFFFITSFKGHVEANWPIVAYPAFLAIAVRGFSQKTFKWTLILWVTLGVLAIASFWKLPYDSSLRWKLKTQEAYTYESILPVVHSHAPLYASSFQMASSLSYYSGKSIYKLRGMGRADHFDFLDGSLPTSDVFFLAIWESNQPPAWTREYKVTVATRIEPRFVILKLEKP
ncbi:MAG: hypothetical protein COT74_05510 [Bdellovibrionales bacterium CG10_big_fil_rev_8_21_14_0_10_45_34]|nr:MAG: hypothetical protein COT74_05510 [Bdellovibrionales bacterium CG10_big_fil_rev_8_21_14_0_10_45_34]